MDLIWGRSGGGQRQAEPVTWNAPKGPAGVAGRPSPPSEIAAELLPGPLAKRSRWRALPMAVLRRPFRGPGRAGPGYAALRLTVTRARPPSLER